jgi:cytochrome c oxidase subunit 2
VGGTSLAAAGAAVGLLIVPRMAWAGALTPESGGSPNADDIHTLYVIALSAALAVLGAVVTTLVFSLVRFRARRGRVAAQVHGNTRLEIGWTLAAVALVVALTVITLLFLPAIRDAPGVGGANVSAGGTVDASIPSAAPEGRALHIAVTGQQYIWRFGYPNGAFSYEQLVVPVGTTVLLDITSQNVAHSWWVPKLGGKFDAIPGYTNHTWFRIPRAGTYRGQCAELCGRNHANMLAEVRAVAPAAYTAWVARQKRLIAHADALARRQRARQSPGP